MYRDDAYVVAAVWRERQLRVATTDGIAPTTAAEATTLGTNANNNIGSDEWKTAAKGHDPWQNGHRYRQRYRAPRKWKRGAKRRGKSRFPSNEAGCAVIFNAMNTSPGKFIIYYIAKRQRRKKGANGCRQRTRTKCSMGERNQNATAHMR